MFSILSGSASIREIRSFISRKSSSRFLLNTRPEGDLRYFSKPAALPRSRKATTVFDAPRPLLRRVRNATGVVLGKPGIQIASQTNMESTLRGQGFQNIDIGEIVHGIRPVVTVSVLREPRCRGPPTPVGLRRGSLRQGYREFILRLPSCWLACRAVARRAKGWPASHSHLGSASKVKRRPSPSLWTAAFALASLGEGWWTLLDSNQ